MSENREETLVIELEVEELEVLVAPNIVWSV
jgi:hypothetical protein